jgi:hypothetical protein
MTVGAYSTSAIVEDLAAKSFDSAIMRLMPNGQSPLFGMTSQLKQEMARQIEHGYFSKTMLFPSMVTSGSTAIGATTVVVVSSANIIPGMIMRADSSNENMLVTAVVSPTQVAVQRAIGTVTPATIADGTSLWMVGNAYEESSLRPQSLIILPTRVINYTQIFRNSWAVSETTRATFLIAGDTAIAESKRDCGAFHAADIEKAFFFGQKFMGTRNNQPFHTMDGLVNAVTQRASGNVTTLAATTNYTQLEAALDPCFNVVTDPTGPAERLLFVGGVARRVLHQIFRANGTYFIEDGQTSWGLQFDTFKIPRGRFRIIEHPLFNAYGQSSTWAKMAVAVDLTTFNKAYMTGRNTENREYNATGQTVVDNGVDSTGGTLTSELTCLVKNPDANNVLYNFTAGVAG